MLLILPVRMMLNWPVYTFQLILIVTQSVERTKSDAIEDKLYMDLLSDYTKEIRPAIKHDQQTNVTLGFLLNQIVDVDERNQVLTTRSWLNVNWFDFRLRWNRSDYESISTMYFPYDKLWKPDIILTNNADPEYKEAIISTHIAVNSFGNVTWLFSAIFRSSCQIKVRYYPFDDQECVLRFACWSHHTNEIDMNIPTEKGDLSNYITNSEFHLMGMKAHREVTAFPCCPTLPWTMVLISIKMRRRPLFYVFNHILPCVLITSMALLGFYVPPDTGEKVTMCITTMLSMGVYLKTITESIPPTAEAAPLIGVYYIVSLTIVCLATTANVWTLNLHRSGAATQVGHVSPWIRRWILGYMATTLRIEIHEPDTLALLKARKANRSTIRGSFSWRRKSKKGPDKLHSTPPTPLDHTPPSIANKTPPTVKKQPLPNKVPPLGKKQPPPKTTKPTPTKPKAATPLLLRHQKSSSDLLKCDCNHSTTGDFLSTTELPSKQFELPIFNAVRVYTKDQFETREEDPPPPFLNLGIATPPPMRQLPSAPLLKDDKENGFLRKRFSLKPADSALFTNLPSFLQTALNRKDDEFPSPTNVGGQKQIMFEAQFLRVLHRLYRTLHHHDMRQAVLEERARIMWEWKQMAVVIDRLLLYIFFTATVLVTFFMLVEPVLFPSLF